MDSWCLWDGPANTGQREKLALDGIKHFNFYRPEFADINRTPTCIHPFFDEITAFCEVSTCTRSHR